jgi:hypothetical protein
MWRRSRRQGGGERLSQGRETGGEMPCSIRKPVVVYSGTSISEYIVADRLDSHESNEIFNSLMYFNRYIIAFFYDGMVLAAKGIPRLGHDSFAVGGSLFKGIIGEYGVAT